jgi:AmmeMemoRadiSam system protein B
LPPLKRGLEAVQIEHEGKPMVLLRDQEGITEHTVAVSLGGFFVATLLNGRHTLNDVQTLYTKTTGALLSPADIQNLVGQLEKADLLETAGLQEKRAKVLSDFLASPVRKPQFMGPNYSKEPLELAVQLGKYFQDPHGPHKELPSVPSVAEPPLGLVSPHIDFHRGGPAYAWAYQALAESPPPDVILALGVAHLSPSSPWVMTKKSYETPYGPVTVDQNLYHEIEKTLWYNPLDDEAVHRTEHSLEFQALWLKYIWRDKTPPWVPILCSSFTPFASDRAPSQIATIHTALEQMGEILKKKKSAGRRVLILAGVDLAHVGPRFGDEMELTPEARKKIEDEDKKSLDLAMKLEADAFYMSVVADDHWRKMCGLSAVYCSLRLIKAMANSPASRGKLLTYGQAEDPMGGIVSYASAIFPS